MTEKASPLDHMRRPTAADYYVGVANSPHSDSFAMWDNAVMSEVEEYADVLEHAQNERPLQAFFYLHRHFLVEHLRGGTRSLGDSSEAAWI